MAATLSPVTVHRAFGSGFEVTFEGKTRIVGYADASPEGLRKLAEEAERRAERAAQDARLARALADEVEARQVEAAERAATQRRERAAATRERNRDPFGFRAMGLATGSEG